MRKPTLHDIELPEQGTANFWDAKGTQYSLQWERDDTWFLYAHRRPGKATPLVTIHRLPEFWESVEVNGSRESRHGTWRDAVQWGM